MVKRIIVAVVGLPIILGIIIAAPPWATSVLIALISAIASYEFINSFNKIHRRRLNITVVLFALAFPLVEGFLPMYFYWAHIFLLVSVLAIEMILSYNDNEEKEKISFYLLSFAVFSAAVMPILLTSILRIAAIAEPRWVYVLLPFIVAFSSDTGGYFGGMFFGKRKLIEKLSPKKTVEGSIGGFVFSVFFMLVYGFILKAVGYTPNFIYLLIYGILGSFFCQIGDLCFSASKRESGIKDFGNILPGHGGMLDRFDSIYFTAPIIELLLRFIPII